MHILVTGAGGMIGVKLVNCLCHDGVIAGKSISRLTRHDIVISPPPPQSPFPIDTYAGDLSASSEAEKLVTLRPDLLFHIAAVPSGEAEADFDKGYRVNLDGTRNLFEAIRRVGSDYRPRLVYTSSIAVFGAPLPESIGDEFLTSPLTSYGTQKAICELLLADYSRRGFFDGIGLRLPTICVRPGKPSLAASSFFSGIIREPLAGREAILPVSEDVRHWHASPRAAVNFLIHAASLDTTRLGTRRSVTLPGVSCTVGEQIAALRRVAGGKAVSLIKYQTNETVRKIVSGWPGNFDTKRALTLGFKAETSFDDIIRIHIEDELGGKIGA
ncbi:MAG: D-erythronate dehydrogenase [Aestuariivirga sp.]